MREKIIGYQFGERMKAELMICSMLMEIMATLKDEQLEGAKKLFVPFFDILLTEAQIASRITKLEEFKLVEEKLTLAEGKIKEGNYKDANENIGKAISHATTVCARMVQVLEEAGLF
ncbi:MAG: hypothetical protein ACXQTS_06980 [Candidatus Methanospirareceae archaeon]